ncbi:MAG: hypothetical protein PHY48_07125 [Candidatus Cloacimonetes bacterium]|nr:hypothetical protein [Candidatus Cloacimonadota bacterium]
MSKLPNYRNLFRLAKYLVNILPAAVLLLSGACSTKYFIPVSGVQTENRYAIVKTDSLLCILRPQPYDVSSHQLNNRFFSMFIRVKNTAYTKQKIQADSFSILVNDKQYDYIPLEYLLANLRQASLLSTYQDPFAILDNQTLLQDNTKEQEAYYELIANSFSFGDILPGAIKEGYLFYDERIFSTDEFAIDVQGERIGFTKSK